VAPSNPYIQQMPAVLLTNPKPPKHQLHGNFKVQRADQAMNDGKRAYQTNDLERARREFDLAVDLMLEALDENSDAREDYDSHLDRMVDAIHRFDLQGLGAAENVEQGQFEKAPLEDILQMTFPVDPRLKDRVREQVAATVSQLPLSVNDTVLGYINYFSRRGHGTVVAGMQRSGRYRPMIQRILDEEGVPQELIHLAQAESGFLPRALSRAAAGGMWQFLTWRGREYGLNQTRYTDERMDPEKATRAAARHLRDLYSQFGDWYLAIAAYNCGPGVVEKAVERTGYADFWELRGRRVIPAETTNYVPIILAMTIMEKNAAEYGLDSVQMDAPLEYDTVDIGAPTSLALISDITDTPLSELAGLNPAVLRGTIPENWGLHVPKGSGLQLTAVLQLVPAANRLAWRMHRVGPGDTLASIGKRYGVTAAGIVAANNLAAAEAAEGDRLLIPAALRPDPPARRNTAAPRKRPATSASAGSGARRTAQKATTAATRRAPKPVAKAAIRKSPVIVAGVH